LSPLPLRHRTAVRVALGALAGLGLLGLLWFTHATPAAAVPGSVLKRGNGPEPESLDPHQARSEPALTVLRDLFEGLTEVGAGGAPVLAAALSYTVSQDGLHYRFVLRPGARWSNGDALEAEDFAAAWRRLTDPATAAQYSQLLAPVLGAAAVIAGRAAPDTLGVRASAPGVLEVDLERPTPYFLSLLSHPATFPLHRASLKAAGRAFTKPGVLVSNGAFTLQRWDFGSHLTLARNPYYWNGAATRLDRVEYYAMTDQSAELAAYRSGDLDITATVPAAKFAWLRQHLGGELHVAPQLAVYYLGLNLRSTPFGDQVALRRALSMVIDRERLTADVTGTGELPAFTFVPPQTLNYAPPLPAYAAWPMQRRIAAARALLAAAGVKAPATLELSYNSAELHNRIAVAVASMWKQGLGIDTQLRAEEYKVLLEDINHGDAAVFRASWLADYDDAYSFLQVLKTGFGINLPRYSSAAYDALLECAGSEVDAGRRATDLEAAEARMLEDQPLIPLYFYVAKHLVTSRVHGFTDNAMNVTYSKALAKDPAP
jgi:oligopeptide transport system substrate-binding protein